MENFQDALNDEAFILNENSTHQDIRSKTALSPRKIRFEGQQSYANTDDYELGISNHGLKFEDEATDREPNNSGRIIFEDNGIKNVASTGLNFQENESENVNHGVPSSGQLTFQDENTIESHGIKKKKRRKRRKPRFQRPQNTGGPLLGQQNSAVPFPGLQNSIGSFPAPHYPFPNVPLGSPYPGPAYPGYGPVGYPGQYYRPQRRKQPSFTSEAFSKITGALTSIALYDDYQCVPRLLCEAAGGGALGSSEVLQSVAGLQPLLTLLSAYNGISSSPLFVFGRAVFLGMTSKTNTAACRYAYPQCPTDPEKLVHYLNNHNGGFFRFFNSPQQNPQNLEQFYQQLMLQGQYGVQNPQPNYGYPYPPSTQNQLFPDQHNQQPLSQQQYYGPYYPQANQQGYGFSQLQNINKYPQYYGLYKPQTNLIPEQNNGFLYPNSKIGYDHLQKYGKNYPYNKKYGIKYISFNDKDGNSENEIQKRIQNKPIHYSSHTEDTRVDQEFIFPESSSYNEDDNNNNRDSKTLKFPDDNNNSYFNNINNKKQAKAIVFPESYNQNLNENNYSVKIINEHTTQPNFDITNGLYIKYYDYYHGNSANFNKYNNFKGDDEGIQTVYIVRGNGDPNNPEIVKIRPGEKVNL
ncbi:unnamed protein product [Diatraea saccharalis]|uniref:Uncharacterized protein n=1 Tax=Diatraea saccharalis TaxID=40085 RepID=A0A9N9RBG3_9NEOP|nr:unnamed protein product [Diatraea saccharalis]